jgi:hypothetical protein
MNGKMEEKTPRVYPLHLSERQDPIQADNISTFFVLPEFQLGIS